MGLAAQNFNDSKGFLPPARVSNDSTDPNLNWVTWAIIMLPFVEQQNFYSQWDITKAYEQHSVNVTKQGVSVYFCPSRRKATAAFSTDTPSGGLSACGTSGGKGVSVAATGVPNQYAHGAMICARWVMNTSPLSVADWKGLVRMATIVDGTSNTFLMGDKNVRRTTKWGSNEDRTVYGFTNGNNVRRFAGLDLKDGTSQYKLDGYTPAEVIQAIDNRAFGSLHPGIVQFVFCDGITHALKGQTDLVTLGRLAEIDDGQVVGDY